MILSHINKNCSKYQAIELIFQKTGDCMKRFFILLPFAFFLFSPLRKQNWNYIKIWSRPIICGLEHPMPKIKL